MQFSQDSTCKFINYRSGNNSKGNRFVRISVADSSGSVISLYGSSDIENKVSGLEFGDSLQLVLDINQWSSGLNVTVIDLIYEKKR